MDPKKICYKAQAETIIKNLEKRNMEGMYFDTASEAYDYLNAQIISGMKVGIGGTMTLEEMGLKQHLDARADITVYRKIGTMTYDEARDLCLKSFDADAYLMSTNALTMEGELLNIDGMGNRVACLIYGPKVVYIVCGMNKVCRNMDEAILRARNLASPANCIRLNRNTPCAKTGKCHDCVSPDTICSQFVYTRYSAIKGRIHVIMIGEELGY